VQEDMKKYADRKRADAIEYRVRDLLLLIIRSRK